MVFVDPRLALWLADGNRRRQLHFGHSKILFGEIASNRRQNFLPSPLVMVKRGMVKKYHSYDRRQKSFEPAA
jgi:hypothetical protein